MLLVVLCRYVRTLRLGHPPAWLALAPEAGVLVVHSHADLALRVFTVNFRSTLNSTFFTRHTRTRDCVGA